MVMHVLLLHCLFVHLKNTLTCKLHTLTIMKTKLLLFILTCLTIVGISTTKAQNYYQDDVVVLMDILEKNSTSQTNLNWKTETDTSLWNCVTWTTSTPARVTELNFSSNERGPEIRFDAGYSTYLAGSVDVTALDSLTLFRVNGNTEVTAINVSGLSKLQDLRISRTKVQELDASGLTSLFRAHFSNTQVTIANFNGCSNLNIIRCYEGMLSEINLSGCTNLVEIEISDTPLSTLDVSESLNLESLYIGNNKLTSINISNLPNLRELYCEYNMLTSLDASNLPKLEILYCVRNNISNLQVVNDTSLTTLNCSNNNIGYIDLTSCKNLQQIHSGNANLDSIIITGLKKLFTINIPGNNLDTLDISGCDVLGNLNLNSNKMLLTALTPLKLAVDTLATERYRFDYENQRLVEALKVGGTLDYSSQAIIGEDTTTFILYPRIEYPDFTRYAPEGLDTNNTGIFTMDSAGLFTLQMDNGICQVRVQVTVTDLKPNTNDVAILEAIRDNNFTKANTLNWKTESNPLLWDKVKWDTTGRVIALHLGEYDSPNILEGNVVFSGLDSLKKLDIDDNHDITDLDLSGLSVLDDLDCDHISVTTLDLSGLKSLRYLNMNDALFVEEIRFDGCDTIYNIDLDKCVSLTSVNLSGITSFYRLDIDDCSALGSLDLSGCTGLEYLYADECNLTSIDLTGDTSLTWLNIERNLLTSLDLTDLINLENIGCYNNMLETIDLTGLQNLRSINVFNNKLKSIDLSGLANLNDINIHNNELESIDLTGLNLLSYIDIRNNKLTLKQAAPAYNHPSLNSKYFNDQTPYDPMFMNIGDNIDFSIEADINVNGGDSITTFILYNQDKIPVDTNQTGIFALNTAGTYYIAMTNSGLTITTDMIIVLDGAGISTVMKNEDFGILGISETKSDTLVVINPGTETLIVTDISMPYGFSAETSAFSVPAGNFQNVIVSFSPVEARKYSGKIVVHSNAAGDSIAVVNGYGVSRIIGLNGDMNFGDIGMGDSVTKVLTFTNTGSDDLVVTGISVPADYKVGESLFTIKPFDSYEVEVTLKPTQITNHDGELIVESNATSGTSTIALIGNGIASSINEYTATVSYIYPNPARERIHLKGIEDNSGIEIYTTTGKLVLIKHAISENSEINISNLENGMYILRIVEANQTLRFIKQ